MSRRRRGGPDDLLAVEPDEVPVGAGEVDDIARHADAAPVDAQPAAAPDAADPADAPDPHGGGPDTPPPGSEAAPAHVPPDDAPVDGAGLLDDLDDAAPDPLADGRHPALRLAGLHLRAGQYALARAELEALANRGWLDEPALLDLAEVRWRTGDLAAAGEAANALLARGAESALALVIATEAVAAAGRPTEARRLSSRALELAVGPLDPLFAGMPRSMVWPVAPAPAPEPERQASAGRSRGRGRGRRPTAQLDGAPSTASEAFAGGRAALARGDASRAALLLGVAMRLEPGFAEDVLLAVAGRDDQPLLALVRGDALRLLGREADALAAFDRARGRSAGPGIRADEPTGPGLFDDEPA